MTTAQEKYVKTVTLSNNTDRELINYVEKIGDFSGKIKKLLLEDMEKNRANKLVKTWDVFYHFDDDSTEAEQEVETFYNVEDAKKEFEKRKEELIDGRFYSSLFYDMPYKLQKPQDLRGLTLHHDYITLEMRPRFIKYDEDGRIDEYLDEYEVDDSLIDNNKDCSEFKKAEYDEVISELFDDYCKEHDYFYATREREALNYIEDHKGFEDLFNENGFDGCALFGKDLKDNPVYVNGYDLDTLVKNLNETSLIHF